MARPKADALMVEGAPFSEEAHECFERLRVWLEAPDVIGPDGQITPVPEAERLPVEYKKRKGRLAVFVGGKCFGSFWYPMGDVVRFSFNRVKSATVCSWLAELEIRKPVVDGVDGAHVYDPGAWIVALARRHWAGFWKG